MDPLAAPLVSHLSNKEALLTGRGPLHPSLPPGHILSSLALISFFGGNFGEYFMGNIASVSLCCTGRRRHATTADRRRVSARRQPRFSAPLPHAPLPPSPPAAALDDCAAAATV